MSEYTRPTFTLNNNLARARQITLPPIKGTDYIHYNSRVFINIIAPAMNLKLPPLSKVSSYREKQIYVLAYRVAEQVLPPHTLTGMPVLPTVRFQSGGGVELPRVSFTQLAQNSIVESATTTDIVIGLTVENAATAALDEAWSVGLDYADDEAIYGEDFRIFQLIGGQTVEASTQVNFAPFQTSASIRLRVLNDGTSEPLEVWRALLVDTATCTLGSIPETSGLIIDDDVAPGGEGLRPQFYFQSEVFGKGPNAEAGNRANMIVDLGPGITFFEDVNITVAAYSPNATESLDGGVTGDYWFPDGKVITVEAGERYGKLQFRATAAGVGESLKWVVVEMMSTNYGAVDDFEQNGRWVAVLTGANDDEHLIPPVITPSTSLDDYKVYANRIEEWSPEHRISPGVPFVINLPFDRTQAGLSARYPSAVLTAVVGTGNQLYNGVAIAAHLAQEIWLDRNNPSVRTFGVRKVYRSARPEQEEIHWIEPHVKYLDIGNPVYISVYEQDANGPHNLNFAGSFDPPQFGAIESVCWGRHFATPNAGIAYPSSTRDLYITSRGHKHNFRNINFGAFQVNFNAATPGEQWHKQCFLDNIHLSGFEINTQHINNFAPVLGIFPPRYTKLWRVAHGLIRIDAWDWVNHDITAGNNGLIFQFRMETPASWIITNCTGTRAERQFFYIDAPGPITLLAYSDLPTGSGRSFLQVVSRPPFCTIPVTPGVSDGRNSGGPSHGLQAVVKNEIYGDRRWTSASDLEQYGHTGELYIIGNRHRGDAGSNGSSQSNRRIYAIQASGDFAGIYVFDPVLADLACEYHPDYPLPRTLPEEGQRFFAFRYVEIADMDYACNGTGSVVNVIIAMAGIFRSKILPVTAAAATPSMGSLPFISFNDRFAAQPDYVGATWPGGSPGGGAVLADPLVRAVLGGPYGPSDKTPNRGGYSTEEGPGSISFPSGFDESIGAAAGSTSKAAHHTFASNHDIPVAFSTLTAGQRDAYDGRDV